MKIEHPLLGSRYLRLFGCFSGFSDREVFRVLSRFVTPAVAPEGFRLESEKPGAVGCQGNALERQSSNFRVSLRSDGHKLGAWVRPSLLASGKMVLPNPGRGRPFYWIAGPTKNHDSEK